jgi:hypothetical protein
MSLNASARLAAWLGLIVAVGAAVSIATTPRTSHTSVVPISSAETVGADSRASWQIALDAMDRALTAGNISGAEMAWHNAYGLAIRSRQWPALLAAGDGALRIGDYVLVKRPNQAHAAEAWRAALFLARAQHSVDGVLRVGDAFKRLGDADAVAQVLAIADGLAATDISGEARRRVLDARQRLTSPTGASALDDPILVLFPDAAVGP